eukprot:749335-Hanusia_phi.AAC.3
MIPTTSPVRLSGGPGATRDRPADYSSSVIASICTFATISADSHASNRSTASSIYGVVSRYCKVARPAEKAFNGNAASAQPGSVTANINPQDWVSVALTYLSDQVQTRLASRTVPRGSATMMHHFCRNLKNSGTLDTVRRTPSGRTTNLIYPMDSALMHPPRRHSAAQGMQRRQRRHVEAMVDEKTFDMPENLNFPQP